MSGSPFAAAAARIPVTVATDPLAAPSPEGTLVLRIEPGVHDHAPGTECVACAAQGDVRAMLFDALTEMRQGARPAFSRVVDASRLSDPRAVIDRLVPGRQPALGMRDHTVARSFYLEG